MHVRSIATGGIAEVDDDIGAMLLENGWTAAEPPAPKADAAPRRRTVKKAAD